MDNASTDRSIAMLREEFPHVRLIVLPKNVGFSAGNNVGIRASRGRYIFLLNPDTVCHPHSIARLCDYMEAHPTTGIAGPRLLNPDGSLQPSRRSFPTFAAALLESTPLQPYFRDSATLRRFYMLDRPDDRVQQVDWLSGAALLCRRETLRQCGLFDTGYFMFSEEVDLCRRVRNAGWKVVYLPRCADHPLRRSEHKSSHRIAPHQLQYQQGALFSQARRPAGGWPRASLFAQHLCRPNYLRRRKMAAWTQTPFARGTPPHVRAGPS